MVVILVLNGHHAAKEPSLFIVYPLRNSKLPSLMHGRLSGSPRRSTACRMYADPMAGYQRLDDLVSQLHTAFDEGASGAAGGAGSKRSAAAVNRDSAEAQRRTDPDMQPGLVPAGLVGSDDPLRMGAASTRSL